MANALLAMLPISASTTLVNGIPLSTIDSTSLRSIIILVDQTTRAFTGFLRDNVTVGVSAADEQVNVSLAESKLAGYAAGLARGLSTSIDYQGSNMSGGQRQRLGIARALIRDLDVLILDECTNAVDTPTRKLLIETLRRKYARRILMFITHDAEVTSVVDEVWHIRDGALEPEACALEL